MSDPCEQHLQATARLIIACKYREFTVAAYNGIDTARQAQRLRDILNKMDVHADPDGLSSSVYEPDFWYVTARINSATQARMLYCKHETPSYGAWSSIST